MYRARAAAGPHRRRLGRWAAVVVLAAACATEPAQSEAVRTIEVVAYRWGFRPEVVRLVRGRPVRFVLRSIDVRHGFSNEALGIERVIPARGEGTTELLWTPDETGEFVFRSHIPSGPGRRRMVMSVFVYDR